MPKENHNSMSFKNKCSHLDSVTKVDKKACHSEDNIHSKKAEKKCCSKDKTTKSKNHCGEDCDCNCCKHISSSNFLVSLRLPQIKSFGNFLSQNKFPKLDVNLFDFHFQTFHPPKSKENSLG